MFITKKIPLTLPQVRKTELFIVLGLFASFSYGASFPCGKASTIVENLICDDKRLSSMDEEMADFYKEALSSADFPEQVRREQRRWLSVDRNNCRNLKCLYRAYQNRISELRSYETSPSESYSSPPSKRYEKSRNSTSIIRGSESEIPLTQNGGVYEIPVVVNEVLKIDFVLDSGAADVSITPDVALTLIRTRTVTQNDWLPGRTYSFADGSTAKSTRFMLNSLRIGDRVINNVACRIDENVEAPMLLGQSALQKLGRYQIDYSKQTLNIK
jgi:aspartyl protease family protein